MLDKIRETIEKENLLNKDDHIVVAVSGGPDSVALLHALYSLDYQLTVCHLNHNVRGQASDGDAAYVKVLADQLGVKAYIFSEDVEAFAKKNKLSFEEAARDRRYTLFEQVKAEVGASKIAVAQNLNDQAETILMRLFRGSGLEGLTSIKYKRDDIIRPLLNCSREEIEAYCESNDLMTRTDHTNFETDYTRNKIRLELIPYIQEHFNPSLMKALFQTTELLNDDLNFIEKHVDEKYESIGSDCFPVEILSEDQAIISRLIRKIILKTCGDIKGISYDHLKRVITMDKHGQKIMIKNMVFERLYDKVYFYIPESDDEIHILSEEVPFVGKHGSIYIGQGGIRIDADQVKGKLHVRTRKPGDRFKPLGMKGHKKLKDFFIDLKIPAHLRDSIYLVCDDENIIWVAGYRMSEDYKVTSETKNQISICLKN